MVSYFPLPPGVNPIAVDKYINKYMSLCLILVLFTLCVISS